jgi:predicted regulator of Ras-like GTPase activity (Roadblock/LC7/MglB family)
MHEIEDAEAALFATKDGLPIAFESRFNPGVVDRLAALSAMLFAVSRKASDIVSMGEMNYIEADLSTGKLFVYRVNDEVFLVVLTSPDTNVGLVRLLAKDAADKARKILG